MRNYPARLVGLKEALLTDALLAYEAQDSDSKWKLADTRGHDDQNDAVTYVLTRLPRKGVLLLDSPLSSSSTSSSSRKHQRKLDKVGDTFNQVKKDWFHTMFL